MNRYVELNRKTLMTRHAIEQLSARYGNSVEEFLSKVGDRLESLYKLTPSHKQVCLTVEGYKLVLEKMSTSGERCPCKDSDEHYLVIVTILSPVHNWRGDRSKRVRKILV
jgi:hypothetical protein